MTLIPWLDLSIESLILTSIGKITNALKRLKLLRAYLRFQINEKLPNAKI